MVSLAMGVMMNLVAGTPMMFGAFENKLKERFGYSETAAMLVATSTQIGLFCGVFQGMLYDRFGPTLATLIATSLLVGGYLLAFFLTMSTPPAPLLALAFFFIGQGSHGLYTASTMTNVANTSPRRRGAVMGLLAAAFGLSAGIFSEISQLFAWDNNTSTASGSNGRGHSSSSLCLARNSSSSLDPDGDSNSSNVQPGAEGPRLYFFLLCAILLAVVGLLGSVVLKRIPRGRKANAGSSSSSSSSSVKKEGESIEMKVRKVDGKKYQIAPVSEETSVDLAAASVASADDSVPGSGQSTTTANLGLADFSFSRAPPGSYMKQLEVCVKDEEKLLAGSLTDPDVSTVEESPPVDVYGWTLLRTTSFLLLFFSMSIEDGCGIVTVNSLSSMRAALSHAGLSTISASHLVLAFSVCNTLGRLSWGAISDIAVARGVTRAFVLFWTMLGMALSHFVMIFSPTFLLFAAMTVGFFFGGMVHT